MAYIKENYKRFHKFMKCGRLPKVIKLAGLNEPQLVEQS